MATRKKTTEATPSATALPAIKGKALRERLIALGAALNSSESSAEDYYFMQQLDLLLQQALAGKREKDITDALDHLFKEDKEAFDFVLGHAETAAHLVMVKHPGDDISYKALLCAIPISAWTRYGIASGKLSAAATKAIQAAITTHIAAPNSKVYVLPRLLSTEDLPEEFCAGHALAMELGHHALGLPVPKAEQAMMADLGNTTDHSETVLADTRVVLFSIAVPNGAPHFSWQPWASAQAPSTTPVLTRKQVLQEWMITARSIFEPLLPGCGLEFGLPAPLHTCLAVADRNIRPHMLRACVHFLEGVDITPATLIATIALYGHDNPPDQVRIGFVQKGKEDVIYGCVWPIFPDESIAQDITGLEATGVQEQNDDAQSDEPSVIRQIVQLLETLGINDLKFIPQILEPEYCDDCGSPLFPNLHSQSVHIEVPEGIDPEQAQRKYH